MKLNLGCGGDIRQGYTNVDYYNTNDQVVSADLSVFPWPWGNCEASEILMLDFLEHFPYSKTDTILNECFRLLKPGGFVDIQVPDFEHCAFAALDMMAYLCNVCGNSGQNKKVIGPDRACSVCNTPTHKISDAAIRRLYGGQDNPGNFHYTAFTQDLLARKLHDIGFKDIEVLDKHHQWKNWNFKLRAFKNAEEW